MKFTASAVAAASVFTAALAADVPPIVVKGSKFFYSNNGTQFFLRGVAYQQGVGTNGSTSGSGTNEYVDPLADASNCQRDIPYLVELRTNVIRTYALDPTKDHDDCMNMLADAGIYVVSDLSEPGASIDRNDPHWNQDLFTRYTSVIDNMAKYTNVLGFFAGNEVSNEMNNTAASAYVKAAVRDSKNYIAQKGYRTIPVGYATNDDVDIRVNMADYFNCGNASEAIDFWGYNIYSWCGDSSYTLSGYDVRTQEFSTYSVPAFFAEYGCNTVQPRTFTDTPVLYGDQMSPVWSGGIVYMYFQEANDFGLVTIDGNSVSTLTDFSYLSAAIATVSPKGTNSASYTPTNSAQSCPANGTTWLAAATPLPPAPNQQSCNCMASSLTCVVMSNTSSEDYGQLFGQVCGYDGNPCAGIVGNATTGDYGVWSMCDAEQRLSFAFNQYYEAQVAANNGQSACDFGGSATTQAPAAATGACKSVLTQAGSSGLGTIASSATGAAASGSKSKAGAAAGPVASVHFGTFTIGAWVIAAGAVGASMLIL